MQINLIYDPSVNNAPAEFKTAMAFAAQYLDNLITNPITVNIRVGWNECGDQPIVSIPAVGPNPISADFNFTGVSGKLLSYDQVRAALAANATSSADATAVSNLPSSDPTQGGKFFIMPALEKAWGLLPANGSELDGCIGFNSSYNWTFDPNNRSVAGELDGIAAAEHELTHVLGRYNGPNPTNTFKTQALFHFSAPGSLVLTSGAPSYFSIDGGKTNLANFDTLNFDGDFSRSIQFDAGSDGGPTGQLLPFTQTDITMMDVLGYNVGALPTVSSISAVTDSHTGYASTGHLVTITLTTSEAVTVTGAPTLQLSDNEVATYSSGSGSNTLTFTYTVQSSDNTSDLQVTGLNLPSGASIADQAGTGLTGSVTGNLGIQVNNAVNDSITKLYIGYYDRAPDPGGETYWAGQLQGGMSLSQIAQSYSVQTESTNLYPFLASPNTASTAAVQAFIVAVYGNLFNRAPDVAGEAYWVSQLQTGASTVGGAIIDIISGATSNDLLTINNKVTVGDYFDTQIFNHNVQFSGAVALAALNAVTFNASSIATAEAIVDAYVLTAPHAAQAATASQTEVNLVGTSPSHDLAITA